MWRCNSRRVIATLCNNGSKNSKISKFSNNLYSTSQYGTYIDKMFSAWKSDPLKVDPSWANYFTNLKNAQLPETPLNLEVKPAEEGIDQQALNHHLHVLMLVRAFRVNGHHISTLDPLGLNNTSAWDPNAPSTLELSHYGFKEEDLDKKFNFSSEAQTFLSKPDITLREIVDKLREIYCGRIGYEYMHIRSSEHSVWLRNNIEGEAFSTSKLEKKDKLKVFDNLVKADLLEKFFGVKFASHKRFGLEGCESLIPGMEALIDRASDLGVESIVVGMPHRGRLNVLCNVVKKPLESVLSEFQHTSYQDFGSGDVKYHLGMSYTRQSSNGKPVNLSLVANPSHLEAVNPVVEGKTRARQFYENDTSKEKTVSILLHGDAAFAGQGVVYETMGLSDLHNYTTGGTVHIIVNNQIGFTTNPRQSRSSPYPSDLAKAYEAPIFHVNGDDPEAVAHVCKLAIEWRQKFHKDVIVDILCYRRYGHNELDEPFFTQPVMYRKIATHPTTLDVYSQNLVDQGVLSQEEIENIKNKTQSEFEEAFQKSKTYQGKQSEWLSSKWKGFKKPAEMSRIQDTGVPLNTLKQIGQGLYTYPQDFNAHPAIARAIKAKEQMFKTGEGFDFATAEALAFGTLLMEGNHVRLSGQDVERGTFSHRHAVIWDQQVKDKGYTFLNHIDASKQSHFTVCNSHLSEFGVLGFELGYSLENPHSLVLWEAQFGDFANGAQVIIDQFLSAGEEKWLRQSGLVLLLPHGYEGAGPEHSSARLERFLQMSGEDPDVIPTMDFENRRQIQESNWQVVNCTTPANYYHVLRRQVHRAFRKPLIVMTGKSTLRLKVSKLEDMAEGTRFQRVIPDNTKLVADSKIRRVIFCSGKVYYDLLKYRTENNIDDVAIVRVEQLAPFPFDKVIDQMQKYSNADITWCQEEAKNMGAWTHFFFRAETCLRQLKGKAAKREVRYVGRNTSASPATGFSRVHATELSSFLKDAFA